jgi:hypothetical protein
LLRDESAAGEVVAERLVDRRALKLEVDEILGKRQLGDEEPVFDRARLLLVDLGRAGERREGNGKAARPGGVEI